ncbi:D-2-hydroxyacid dehydrogenase family protein [Pseudoroseomonas cervicalis]|uniref:D-2-hydroxyacid dehydrogenase family protein n=1 Tax=Teichococcus cervicalis TaxID=204525 RepID=UPI00278A7F24|nr:D-2-hydroxyacid dehydrogenase family protein [Pseudoroseomonas cervicalis]MDQ1077621.1 phosphoglycerate dehydrogenase-like enzyme [Pseudoroseomonas cervicalis]
MRIAVLDDYQQVARGMADWSALGEEARIDFLDRPLAALPLEAAAAALAEYEVLGLMRERMPMPAALLARLPRLRLIVTTGARNPSLDVAAARARGITVCHTGGGESYHATTELALALMLNALRHLPGEEARMRQGLWQGSVGRTLHGRVLGLAGLGRLGGRMAELGRAFGMEVIAWSENLTAARCAELGVRQVGREALFRGAEILSLHLVLSERSRGLVGPAEFALMRPDAVLINTSRGPLVQEAALIEALRSRRIAAAGLDVYDQEPLPADHPLRGLDNVVLSPHLGYVTEGTYRVFFRDMVEAIAAWKAGAPVRLLD